MFITKSYGPLRFQLHGPNDIRNLVGVGIGKLGGCDSDLTVSGVEDTVEALEPHKAIYVLISHNFILYVQWTIDLLMKSRPEPLLFPKSDTIR
jgi:hypothetical protein